MNIDAKAVTVRALELVGETAAEYVEYEFQQLSQHALMSAMNIRDNVSEMRPVGIVVQSIIQAVTEAINKQGFGRVDYDEPGR